MTRADPPLHLATMLVAAMTLVGVACNSDDREQLPGTTSGTTLIDPTMENLFTTGEPVDSTSTTEVPIPKLTCRGGVYCATQCAISIPNPTPAEYNWQMCFFDNCLEELTTEEWLLLFDLTECIVNKCSATPECMNGEDEPCNNCYFLGLGNGNPPPGDVCELQAKACN